MANANEPGPHERSSLSRLKDDILHEPSSPSFSLVLCCVMYDILSSIYFLNFSNFLISWNSFIKKKKYNFFEKFCITSLIYKIITFYIYYMQILHKSMVFYEIDWNKNIKSINKIVTFHKILQNIVSFNVLLDEFWWW